MEEDKKQAILLIVIILSLCVGFFIAGYRMNVVAIDVKYNNMCYLYVYEHCSCTEAKQRTAGTDSMEYPDVNDGFNWSWEYGGN